MKKTITILFVLITTGISILFLNACKKENELQTQECTPPNPPYASNNSPLSIGDTLKLQAESIAGASYLWSGPRGFSSTQQNPILIFDTVIKAGNYQVKIIVDACTSKAYNTYVNACRTRAYSNSPIPFQDTFKVRLYALDILDAEGQTVPATYYWSGPNGFSSNLQNPIITSPTMDAVGTYSVYAVTNNENKITPVSTTYFLLKPKAINFTANYPAVGENLNLSAPTVANGTYLWKGPDNFTSTDQNPVITGVTRKAIGSYTLTYFLNGIESDPKIKYVHVKYSNDGCGGQTTLSHNGINYNVVEIGGTQCWVKEDMTRSGNKPGNPLYFKYSWAMPTADTQGVCPTGWHLPTINDWQNLAMIVGHDGNALKELGQGSGSGAGTNVSAFSGMLRIGSTAKYWSSSSSSTTAMIMQLYNTNSYILFNQINQTDSCLVRCIKD